MFELFKSALNRRLLISFILFSIISTSILIIVQLLVQAKQQSYAISELENTLQGDAVSTLSNLVTTKSNYFAERINVRNTQLLLTKQFFEGNPNYQHSFNFSEELFNLDPSALQISINTNEEASCFFRNKIPNTECYQKYLNQNSNGEIIIAIEWEESLNNSEQIPFLIQTIDIENGSIQIKYNLLDIVEEIPRFGISSNSTLLLLDQQGTILAIPSWGDLIGLMESIRKNEPKIIGKLLIDTIPGQSTEMFSLQNINNYSSSETPSIVNSMLFDESVYFSFMRVSNTPLIILLISPTGDIYKHAKLYGAPLTKMDTATTIKQSLVFLVGVTLVIFIGALITLRELTQPIAKLKEQAVALTENELNTPIPESGKGELKVLAATFNKMANSIQTSQKNLQFKQQELEFTLKTRVEELNTMNAIISLINETSDLPKKLSKLLEILQNLLNFESAEAFLVDQFDHLKLVSQIKSPNSSAMENLLKVETNMPITFAGHKIGEIKIIGHEDFLTEGYHHDFVTAFSTTIGVLIKNAELQGQLRIMVIAEERRHLARELHDSVTQSLFSALLAAEGIHAYFKKNEDLFIQKAIRLLQDQLNQVRSQMRGLILELRPVELENQSLKEAVLGHAASLERSTGLQVTCNLEGCIDKLPYEIKIGLNRIIQESLSNIARHAQAKHVWISLTCKNEAVSLQVRDDGKGFDATNSKHQVGSYGLINIRERANIFGGISKVISELGGGTTILVEIPLNIILKD